jgi:hypothetical protein
MYRLAQRFSNTFTLMVGVLALGFAARDAAAQSSPAKTLPSTGGWGGFRTGVMTSSTPGSSFVPSPDSNPYSPYPTYGGDPFGGYLTGSASVINAQSDYLVKTQQAYLMKEQVRSAQLQYRRQAFDEWLYEKANTPSLNDERERIIREEVRRAPNAPLTEIWSAKALNDLLGDAQKFQSRSGQGPNVPIDEEILKKINLTQGDGSNLGLLKNDGKLELPLALRALDGSRDLREELQVAVSKAYNEAKEGKSVDVATIQKIDDNLTKLQNMLVKNVGNVPFAQYSDAKTYLRQLDDAVKVLKKGDTEFLNGHITPKAGNVAELVEFMSRKGYQFAPATGNEKAAYVALHKALVAYSARSTLAADPKER